MNRSSLTYDDAVKFHGHSCPGLALGYRATTIALNQLFSSRSSDEELVAIVENDACGVDAVQLLSGCTFGKGNLFFRDYGKMAFTFYNRKNGEGVRIYLEFPSPDSNLDKRIEEIRRKKEKSEAEKQELSQWMKVRTDWILNLPEEKLVKISNPREPLPGKARIFKSLECQHCGERMMETRAQISQDHVLCLPCSARKTKNG